MLSLVLLVAATTIFCVLFWRRLLACITFLSEKPNPILQLVYLSLVFGIFHVFRQHGFQHVSDVHHKGAWFMVLLASGLFVVLCFSGPVVLTNRNVAGLSLMVKADGLVFPLEAKSCSTCHVQRLARSKHCSVCGHCVHVFDHHCFWANACIAQNNKGVFLLFLLATALLCFYCVYLCVWILLMLADRNGLSVTNTAEFCELFFLRGGVFRNMAVITVVAGVAVFAFFVFHLRLACLNMTTNEYVSCLVYSSNSAHFLCLMLKGM
jgi:hypothetical protein